MLKRNEILETLKTKFQEDINDVLVLLDDIMTLDVSSLPLIILKQKDTQISIPSCASWKHSMDIEIEIIADNKSSSDILLENILLSLEGFSGIKNVTNIDTDKIQITASEVFNISIGVEMIYFTPSFRA